MFTADFETTTEIPTRVWLWAICDENERIVYDITIDSFFQEISKARYNNEIIYFHNLKFDGYFVLYHLLKVLNYSKCNHASEPFTYDTLINRMGVFYAITINTGKTRVRLYDSYKKITMSVASIPKAYGLDAIKGEIDYTSHRDIGYEPTKEELDYIHNDVLIVMQALKIQQREGLTRMTAGSDAFHAYKSSLPNFSQEFPALSAYLDEFCRRSYRGGFVYLNPAFGGSLINNGSVYDVNSMYPWSMRYMGMPRGRPREMRDEFDVMASEIWIGCFQLNLELKDDGIPFLQRSQGLFGRKIKYVTSTVDSETFYLTSVDYELVKENYDIISSEFIEGYAFKCATGLFDDYIDHWMHIKTTETGSLQSIAKLMQNSLYGKFAKNPDVTQKIPYYDESKDKIELMIDKESFADPIYVPLSCFVTAWARYNLIHAIKNNYENFIYCDTDSIHIKGTEFIGEIHPTKLGAWKLETKFVRGKYLQAKTYILEYINSKGELELKITAAGLPKSCHAHVTFDNFEIGTSYPDKLIQRSVSGGCLLIPTTHQIRGL